MSKVKINDINMYYEIHGEGEPLIMIMGWGGNITTFGIPELISKYSQKYKVIAFDNRGAGRTDKPDMSYSVEMMAEDTIGLMDALGIEKAHINGTSFGGRIGMVMAAKYPERVNGLILHVTVARLTSKLKNAVNSSLETEESRKEELKKAEMLFQMEYPPTHESYLRQLEAGAIFDGRKFLDDIKAPTLIVNGTNDYFVPIECTKELAASIKDSKLVLVEGGDHMFAITNPDLLIKPALEFLEEINVKSIKGD